MVALVTGGDFMTRGCGQTPWLPVCAPPSHQKKAATGLRLTSPVVPSRGPRSLGEPVPPSCPHFRVHSPLYAKGKKVAETGRTFVINCLPWRHHPGPLSPFSPDTLLLNFVSTP